MSAPETGLKPAIRDALAAWRAYRDYRAEDGDGMRAVYMLKELGDALDRLEAVVPAKRKPGRKPKARSPLPVPAPAAIAPEPAPLGIQDGPDPVAAEPEPVYIEPTPIGWPKIPVGKPLGTVEAPVARPPAWAAE